MMSRRSASYSALLCVSMLPTLAHADCVYSTADGERTQQLLQGAMVEGENRNDKERWREYHHASGTTEFSFTKEERSYKGKWRIENEAVCYNYGKDENCFRIEIGVGECAPAYRMINSENEIVADLQSINWLGARSDECFLTTATSRLIGLPDDCDQLQILRWYRDNVLRKCAYGIRDVDEYYEISPAIVEAVFARGDEHEVFGDLCNQIIIDACRSVRQRKHTEAYKDYRRMFEMLRSEYL